MTHFDNGKGLMEAGGYALLYLALFRREIGCWDNWIRDYAKILISMNMEDQESLWCQRTWPNKIILLLIQFSTLFNLIRSLQSKVCFLWISTGKIEVDNQIFALRRNVGAFCRYLSRSALLPARFTISKIYCRWIHQKHFPQKDIKLFAATGLSKRSKNSFLWINSIYSRISLAFRQALLFASNIWKNLMCFALQLPCTWVRLFTKTRKK